MIRDWISPDIDRIIETVEYCNQLPVHPRHPYGGELVFTAFSGSHQDAIKKGFEAHAVQNDEFWRVPYLPIDPADLGRTYEAVIRVNSQSGKGGFAWVLEQGQGLKLPKKLQVDFSRHVQRIADELGRELNADDIWQSFQDSYYLNERGAMFQLVDYEETRASDGTRLFAGTITVDGQRQQVSGRGKGLVSSVLATLQQTFGLEIEVLDYFEHALGKGTDARAAAYLECALPGRRNRVGRGHRRGRRHGVGTARSSAPPTRRWRRRARPARAASKRRGSDLDHDPVSRANLAAFEHDRHDPGLAQQRAVGRLRERCRQRARAYVGVDLAARIAQPGHLDQRCRSDPQTHAARQREQVDALRGDVLAERARRNLEARCGQLLEKLGMDQVDLTQVGRFRLLRLARKVLHGRPRMCIALDTEPFDQRDAVARHFREAVRGIAGDGEDAGAHAGVSPAGCSAADIAGTKAGDWSASVHPATASRNPSTVSQ